MVGIWVGQLLVMKPHPRLKNTSFKQIITIFLQVTFSMLEIYNEQVQDLLAVVKKNAQKGPGLKVRQNPKSGFYVEGLKV